MGMIGVISGTVLIDTGIFGNREEKFMDNDFGHAVVFVHDNMVFLPRHGINPKDYILPHRINHQANMQALKDAGVKEVVAVNSTGSLKMSITPGTIMIPDDFIMIFGTPTVFSNRPQHITPVIDYDIRKRLIGAAHECEIDVTESGIYWQTTGPRFETKAEITMMSAFADIVGMTMGSEAVIAQELGLPYASLCSVDNYAHGLGEKPLTMEEIYEHARINAEKMIKIIHQYVSRRR